MSSGGKRNKWGLVRDMKIKFNLKYTYFKYLVGCSEVYIGVFFTVQSMEFTLESFVENPTWETLGSCRKAELLLISLSCTTLLLAYYSSSGNLHSGGMFPFVNTLLKFFYAQTTLRGH